MQRIIMILIAGVCLLAAAPAPEPPLAETRLTVHTLLREDIFAGILEDDMDRLARGEKNIDILLEKRPADKATLLVLKAGTTMYRAVRALEAKRSNEFDEKYAQAIDLLSQAKKLGPKDLGVIAPTAGFYAMMADRLPEKLRAPAWSSAYESYQALWKAQEPFVKQLPLHLRGELLGGLAQSAQRTGHNKELALYLDKILALAPDSAYARVAKQWKEDPKAAADRRITCLSCHSPGRLAARQSALEKK
ncbi:MAG TPA: hypothetical protein VGY58_19100 [Gemmataceae bacterium]|nr:hypothetical protein [Gemmataceae bacterium]